MDGAKILLFAVGVRLTLIFTTIISQVCEMKCWLADFLQVPFVELEDPPLIAASVRGRAATSNTCQIEGGYWFEAG